MDFYDQTPLAVASISLEKRRLYEWELLVEPRIAGKILSFFSRF